MRALLADHDRHEREIADAYAAGYRDGHTAGWEIGYGHAHHEMAEAWSRIAAHVRGIADTRTQAQREALDAAAVRGQPCPAGCGRCSRCVRAAAVARYGGDYPGLLAATQHARRSA
jgi:hypothetical protein